MKTGNHTKFFKVGTNWSFLFRVKDLDLTAATISIIIKRIGSPATVFDSATNGTYSVTLDGTDTVILWDIPYALTGDAAVGKTYHYDMEVTASGNRQVYVEGDIFVERNR
jgi:hypothetical protein